MSNHVFTEDLPSPETLQEVMVPIVNNSVCAKAYKSMNTITDNMMCAGVGGKDSCQVRNLTPAMLTWDMVQSHVVEEQTCS